MKTVIVLAMHGAPPKDFPRDEMAEYFTLHGRLENAPVSHSPALEQRYEELDARMRCWPRTASNDPFYFASQELAAELGRTSGREVMLGFNEFCAPTLEEALEKAASFAGKVFVVTPMMTRGGEHSEKDIVQAVCRAQQKHPGVEFIYAWPFETSEVAAFLAAHVKRFENA